MFKVFKYELPVRGKGEIEIPTGSKILHVAEQHGSLQVWAMVNPEQQQTEIRTLLVAGTGHEIDDSLNLAHVNTFFMQGGMFVFHAFEVL